MSDKRLSEFELIAHYFAPLAATGALGLLDDAAIITPLSGHDLVITKDMLVADRHFFENDPPEAIAAKALRVNLSDLAAKGAKPLGFLLGLALPQDWQSEWLEHFAAGLAADISRYECSLLGGDTVRASDKLTLSITAFGCVPVGTMVRRTTVNLGDILYVTGTIGDAALGLQLRLKPEADWATALPQVHKAFFLDRYLYPQPRQALADSILNFASACMDISDGFIGDLSKMLINECALDMRAAQIPLSYAARAAYELAPELLTTILTGGDDYELLIAIPPAKQTLFEQAATRANIPVTQLGIIYKSKFPRLIVRNCAGEPIDFTQKSYVHF